jgi:transposase-like protein
MAVLPRASFSCLGIVQSIKAVSAPQYNTEQDARQYLEGQLWQDGPFCPHCGVYAAPRKMSPEQSAGTHGRKGLYQCRQCRKQFTVTVGTIFEHSKIPLHKWLLAVHRMCAANKRVSALQLQKDLDLGSYRSAWFMCRRIRWAIAQSAAADESLLIRVKPGPGMPRPGANRQKSVWSEVDEEMLGPKTPPMYEK